MAGQNWPPHLMWTGTARLEPRHRAPFACLADQLAVQESDDIDAVVEANAKLAAAGPGDLSGGALAGLELDRRRVAQRGRKIARRVTPSALILRIEQAWREPAI